jgi:hypothetical protein
MPGELMRMLLRKSVGAMRDDRTQCARCRRTPLIGELLHVLESGRVLCSLCLEQLPAPRDAPLRTERVHATERPLVVGRRAA